MSLAPKPLVAWAGGKRRLLKYLLPLIAKHTCYVEAFGGAVLFSNEKSKVEVYNDLNGDLVNLLRQTKWHHEELLREMAFSRTVGNCSRPSSATPESSRSSGPPASS